jgi:hypothetical protein
MARTSERLKRREIEERHNAVLQFCVAHPDATGDEIQDALTSGVLTGKKGPPMNIGNLYRLKRQALQLSQSGASLTPAPLPLPHRDGDIVKQLKALVSQIQKLLATDPAIAELTITKSGARIVRTELRGESL